MAEKKVYGYTYFDGETTRNVYALDWDMTTVNVYSHYWGKHCTVLKGVKYFLDDKKAPYSYWESSFAIPDALPPIKKNGGDNG